MVLTVLMLMIADFANEFWLANMPSQKEVLSHQPLWKPPQNGVFKINCDASLQLRTGKAGLGHDYGIHGVILESDSAGVVKIINDKIVPRTELGVIIQDVLNLPDPVGLVSTEGIRKGANSVAHGLAQLALSLDSPVVWLKEVPPDIEAIVGRMIVKEHLCQLPLYK
ncbi:hypothetical protein Dsin_025146 [Dipteronia sinensis]|uniref:RNase H type-1 domain-containing protein n=1 Tax=Dipteronia sinensis TaxID=43782 RepID=A0AAD9ZVV1_9ROSI|nr:hypothetical protein Dsin_025146 [Dipteronia sinensis]